MTQRPTGTPLCPTGWVVSLLHRLLLKPVLREYPLQVLQLALGGPEKFTPIARLAAKSGTVDRSKAVPELKTVAELKRVPESATVP